MSFSETSDPFLIARDIFNVLKVDHTGCCGYICLANLLQFPNWISIALKFIQHVNNPFFTSKCRARIGRLKAVLDAAKEEGKILNALDSNCYLTANMCKLLTRYFMAFLFLLYTTVNGLAMAMNLQFLVFRKFKSGAIKSYECCFVGGGSNVMPLAVHCLLHHGGERFDVLTIAESAKSEEVSIKLIKMGHDLQKQSEEYSALIEFADVDDDTEVLCAASSAAGCGTSAVTVEDTDDDDDNEDDDEDGNADGVLPSASEFAARLLMSLGSSDHTNDDSCMTGSTPHNASSLGVAILTTTKPRVLNMGNFDEESPAAGGDAPFRDNDLPQNDDALREQDTIIGENKTSTVQHKKVATHNFLFLVSCNDFLFPCSPVPGYFHYGRSWHRAGDCGKRQ
jgi:hypothetical protein